MNVYGRVFALVYDRLLTRFEGPEVRELRRRCLAQATGRTLELGAGPGNNRGLYPAAVTELVLSEPEPPMFARLAANIASQGDREQPPTTTVQASAEQLPFGDATFDTVSALLVLCTVPDPERALAETARVLRPGGQLLFFEHVRAAREGRLSAAQDRWERPWKALGHGCHCNRPTPDLISASGLEVDELERGELPKVPPIIRPCVLGRAHKPE